MKNGSSFNGKFLWWLVETIVDTFPIPNGYEKNK